MAKKNKSSPTMEHLDARIAAQQEKVRARRASKVTPEDVARRLAERRERKAVKPSTRRAGRVVPLVLGGALLAISGIVATATVSGTETFKITNQSLQQQIAAAQGDLDAQPAADQQSAAEYADQLKQQIAEAMAKAEKIATLQQEFAQILFKGNSEHTENGAPSAAFLESVQHRKLLAPYFVDRAFLVEDAVAYAPGSTLPFDSGKIDPRFPWFLAHPADDPVKLLDPSGSTWTVASVVATKTPGVLEATWVDSNAATGQLFSWATASYYSDEGKFGSLKVGTTTLSNDGSIQTAGN
jgi:hypothetical protein